MANFSHTDSISMYSWWWDSHICPKNSKWLQENLTGMDAKIKTMIKLIEEDADSFARRAEMYYKKRPELMKMVEDFYRAYRALAERYDHATGVIQQAHRTMAEAFPNQVPMMFADDSHGIDDRMPEISTPPRVLCDDLSDPKHMNHTFGTVEHVRKGLNFDKPQKVIESDEIVILKERCAEMEIEKKAKLVSYQDKLSQLESQIVKAENEVFVLKEELAKLETERESNLQEYQIFSNKILNLQKIISNNQDDAKNHNERSNRAETEARFLKCQLDKLTLEKDAALNQYMESLEMISNLEKKLRLAEEDARTLKEGGENAERDVEILKQTISNLEKKLERAEDESKRLLIEIDNGEFKLKGAEEQCLLLKRSNQSLNSELESKLKTQTRELIEKQKELGRVWVCLQEERLRFSKSETDFQTLQHLHAQTQQELRFMASELQNREKRLKDAETCDQSFEEEISILNESKGKLEKPETLEQILEKNSILETSLFDSNAELEIVREKMEALEKSCESLLEEKSTLLDENATLMTQIHETNKNPEKLSENRSVLVNSFSEVHSQREVLKRTSEISEADNSLSTKDIVLDQTCDNSSYSVSKRETADLDDQMFELWETADPNGTIGLTVSTLKKTDSRRVKSMRKKRSQFPPSDSSEISKRLDLDVQKLANLQITVQDLKRKLEVTEKGKRGKAVIECEALKGQLEEADVAIMKLFGLNGRLVKRVEENSFSDENSSFDLEREGNVRRKRRVPEQARRISGKIERLQLEVQKLQFVLLKLDDKNEGKSEVSEAKRRVLLRDYLYGGGRTDQRRKKTQFCACVG